MCKLRGEREPRVFVELKRTNRSGALREGLGLSPKANGESYGVWGRRKVGPVVQRGKIPVEYRWAGRNGNWEEVVKWLGERQQGSGDGEQGAG